MKFIYHPCILGVRRPKYSILGDLIKKRGWNSFSVLDVGIANNSQSEWLRVFKNTARYDGVDCVRPSKFLTNPSLHGKTACRFYEVDLNRSLPSERINRKYDVICVSHVLEHLLSPYSLVSNLFKLLNPRGLIYLEYPNLLSVQRSWISSYYFYGDSTHIQPINTALVIESCRGMDVQILDFGRCRPVGKLVFSSLASLSRLISLRPGWRDPLLYLAGMVDFCLIEKR
jgi:2-polyprenyl-3-methyl-5-hydroxy-6-metoxy-1,4-benzoquinol methylase